MTKYQKFAFGFCSGIMVAAILAITVMVFNSERIYTVYHTNDHVVTMKAKDGHFIKMSLENVPENIFYPGAAVTINYMP